MDVPSMVQRSGDTLIVRSVVSGDQIYLDQETGKVIKSKSADRSDRFQPGMGLDTVTGLQGEMGDDMESQVGPKDEGLPQCKIKRNYSCNSCTFFTQNPRYFLTHLRDVHGEKIVINECKLCLYASRHYQKLVRHMKMVHGSTEGIEDHAQARKRQIGREGRKRKIEDTVSNISPAHKANLLSPPKYDDITADDAPQNRLLKCSLCEYTTLYRAQLVEHEQDEHCKTKFFRCEKCTYVTHIKARFSKHVKYHSMPMIKCVTCDFRTPYKWNLDRHMKNHGGTGPFKCAACNFTADIKQSLTVHEMNHHIPPVGHAAGMSLNRRRNKVGGTDLVDDYISEIGDLEVEVEDSLNNNNNIEDFEESMSKRYKYEEDDQPTDLSQKSNNEVGGHTNKKVMRPVPNLIPIQAAATGNALNLSKNFVMKLQKEFPAEKAYFSELASFLFAENKLSELATSTRTEVPQLSPVSSSSTTSKKKNSNFFDKLKETLAIDAARSENLNCPCGHTSKCLSESILHRNSCNKADAEDKRSSSSPINLSVNSTSTRCQFCRHRCKSSADLASHIRNCADAANCPNDSYDSLSDINDKQEGDTYESNGDSLNKHPMENRIFVWNKLPMVKAEGFGRDEDGDHLDGDEEKKQIALNCGENGYYGVETAPGYGEVTKKMTSEDEAANSSLKKVYKCPHCSFWASTASRFHVHIVGHLNKKPFECSFCAYRSNWRWDITKHIRLKTIRDPNHKMARVLMNDETGRRNYTKYNKYITLMKVTEEDGDPKLMKSGEMTPHQEASLAFINSSSLQKMKSGDETMDEIQQNDIAAASAAGVMGMDPTRLMRLPFFKQAMGLALQTEQECTKRSPPPLLKPAEDLVAQNTDFKLDGSEKKTLFRCRKCNYKNASHDMVLSHVKGHYQDAGINLAQKSNLSAAIPVAVNSNLCMNNVLAAMCLTQQQLSLGEKGAKQQQQHPLLSGSLGQPPVQPTVSAPQSAHNAPGLPNNPHNLGGAPKPSEHGETDEASSGVVTTSGTGVTGWRSPAPYRCGHCHQVSNWKHVIQRHCRLKHNSDIRIETVDRNSNKNSPVYHPLVTPAGGGPPNVLINANNASQGAKTSAGSQDGLASNISTKPYASNFSYDQGGDQKGVASLGTRSDLEPVDKMKQRRQQCPSCPFVSESKSQMNYHVSLHKTKPEIFECQTCGFTTSKRQQFIQHKKVEHDEEQMEDQAIDLRSNNLVAGDRAIYFCQKCPGRFFSIKDLSAHVNLHGANHSFVCKVCTYSTRQEHDLRLHLMLHTDTYQEKTERLCMKFAVSPDHARPSLKREPHGSWLVGRASDQQSDLEDSIQKNIIVVEDGGNHQVPAGKSLLKAQLENGEAPIVEGTLERCSDCPFETHIYDEYKKHIQCHECVSNCVEKLRCFACDFSTSDEEVLKEHRKLHVMPIAKAKLVDFYTNYNSLELNLVSASNHGSNQLENVYKSESEKSDESGDLSSSGHRVILDAATGEIIGERSSS